ncbi:hypothetical protein EB118_11405 [bacterium]|nr:hypothetical protein [bacterium]NDD83463.1 hypothetical protein [bacterium]NDG30664.1 hypothetical protein [bacterium]
MFGKTFLIKILNMYDQELYKDHSAFHKGDAGLDLFVVQDQIIPAEQTGIIDMGISCQCRSVNWKFWEWFKYKTVYGYHSYFLFPRSSIHKTPLMMKNSIGLIDAGYLGPIKMCVYNTSKRPYLVKRGERYAQLVNSDLHDVRMKLVASLRKTTRGQGGLGSTGA